ncbi:HAD-IIIA family hydrolase [Actinoplanes sp. CA-142083]|uniref:HAD-IIIA family hydrolase n=1 Tax=Actinoplanes sp. CA-142083 TaxID=3239903 RepID=UPI003D89E33F
MSLLFDAVLFDRDGTLVVDVPYNGDPGKVVPMPGARSALDRLRAAGLRLGVVTNQSGLARGHFTGDQLDAVNRRVEELLGPFGTWQVCPHDDAAGCACRKPAPGLVIAAADALGTTPARCVLVGDIGRDMSAALAAGATGILVPTRVTLSTEIAAAPAVAETLAAAADQILRREDLVRPGAAGTGHVRPSDAGTGHARPAAGTGDAGTGDARPVAGTGDAGSDLAGRAPGPGRAGTVLVVRSDSAGDVLVTGPGIRAVAAGADRVVLLCGPRGRAAAELLPGVDEIVEWRLPWIDANPGPVDPAGIAALVARIRQVAADEAIIFTSFHQSPLPLALLLRLAKVPRISAISEDYPGALLDVRHRVPDDLPEPERARSLAAAAGFALPAEDDGALRLTAAGRGSVAGWDSAADRESGAAREAGHGSYVIVHPGAAAGARACPPETLRAVVAALADTGHEVLVSAGPGEELLAAQVAGDNAGWTAPGSLEAMAGLIAGASCLIVGNTGPAHLAAAVGTPVVSLYAPTVPFGRWGPYRVPVVRLGVPDASCRDSRATDCPVPGHPCLSTIDPAAVLDAVRVLGARPITKREVAA